MLGRGADFLDALARKVPFGAQMFADPLRDINVSLTQRSAQKILPGLLAEQEKRRLLPSLLLPGFAASNGLLAE